MSVNSALILSIICDAITIVGFAMNLHFSKQSKKEKWRWVLVAIALVISFSFTVYNGSELSRIKNIHRQASTLCEHYSTSYCEEYILEAITFLEENRERYPDYSDIPVAFPLHPWHRSVCHPGPRSGHRSLAFHSH